MSCTHTVPGLKLAQNASSCVPHAAHKLCPFCQISQPVAASADLLSGLTDAILKRGEKPESENGNARIELLDRRTVILHRCQDKSGVYGFQPWITCLFAPTGERVENVVASSLISPVDSMNQFMRVVDEELKRATNAVTEAQMGSSFLYGNTRLKVVMADEDEIVCVQKNGRQRRFKRWAFEQQTYRLPPPVNRELKVRPWLVDAAWDVAAQMRLSCGGRVMNGQEYLLHMIQQEGYSDLLKLTHQADTYILCNPERGLDGSQVEIPARSPLGVLLEEYICRMLDRQIELPVFYPYDDTRAGIQRALEAGRIIPMDVLMAYPELLARFGV